MFCQSEIVFSFVLVVCKPLYLTVHLGATGIHNVIYEIMSIWCVETGEGCCDSPQVSTTWAH